MLFCNAQDGANEQESPHTLSFSHTKSEKNTVLGALPGLILGTKNGPKIETATVGVSKNGAEKRPQTVSTKTTFWNPVGAQPGADVVAMASHSVGQRRSIRAECAAPESGRNEHCAQP